MLSIWGSKYLEYISRIRNTAMICPDNNEDSITEYSIMKQAECKQYTIYNKQKHATNES
jgi:hypothetical protein